MAACLFLLPSLICYKKSLRHKDRRKYGSNTADLSKILRFEAFECFCSRCFFTPVTSFNRVASMRLMPPGVLSSAESLGDCDQTNACEKSFVATGCAREMEFNRVNCLVWELHQSARGFSSAIQELELDKTGSQLAMAWIGVDVHAWHKSIAYQVAVYSLLKAAIEVELFLSQKRCNVPAVKQILSQKANLLRERVESQLRARNPKLVQWFRTSEVPRVAGHFIPLFKKWSMDYAGSGVAGIVLAISCCAAVRKLCAARVSCPLFPICFEDGLLELTNLSHTLVSVDKLHQLACEAGFEDEFLSHFGRKIFPSQDMENIEFWIGLVQRKLSAAFHRERVIIDKLTFSDKVQETSLATIGLFAYLGRETRLYLAGTGLNDLEEQTKDFLSYLECGCLAIYPEFSILSQYQLFMEVVADEIGWLHFYPAVSIEPNKDRKRSKQHTTQAEKEIILFNVLSVCYDIITGFAHYSYSSQQPIGSHLLEFLLQSQSLLSTCMEDYWAAYDKASEQQKVMERVVPEPVPSLLSQDILNKFTKKGVEFHACKIAAAGQEEELNEESSFSLSTLNAQLLKKSLCKLLCVSSDAWMGTQLLSIDIVDVAKLLRKRFCGCKLTKREANKMKRTLADFLTLIPVIILMLIPVSAVGHAAIFAAIKKYAPYLIPSPYTSERLGLVRQLKRIKNMEFQARNSVEDASSTVN